MSVEGNDQEANELWGYFASQIEGLKSEGQLSKDTLNQTLFSLYQMSSTPVLDQ